MLHLSPQITRLTSTQQTPPPHLPLHHRRTLRLHRLPPLPLLPKDIRTSLLQARIQERSLHQRRPARRRERSQHGKLRRCYAECAG
jgi:hypothetical protein